MGGAFWAYLAVTVLFSMFLYHLLFTVKEERRQAISAMTPPSILPIFTVMLAGTLAGVFSKAQPAGPGSVHPLRGDSLHPQGLGLPMSIFEYSTYLSRPMAFGLSAQKPGMFMADGPPSCTWAALVSMANDVPRAFREPNQSIVPSRSRLAFRRLSSCSSSVQARDCLA